MRPTNASQRTGFFPTQRFPCSPPGIHPVAILGTIFQKYSEQCLDIAHVLGHRLFRISFCAVRRSHPWPRVRHRMAVAGRFCLLRWSLLPPTLVSFASTWVPLPTQSVHTNTHIRTGQIDLGVIWVYTHIHTLSLSLSLTHTHTYINTHTHTDRTDRPGCHMGVCAGAGGWYRCPPHSLSR